MGLGDKIENKVEDVTGKAKESAGRATDDKSLENEGRIDQKKSSMKDAVEDVKDAFKK